MGKKNTNWDNHERLSGVLQAIGESTKWITYRSAKKLIVERCKDDGINIPPYMLLGQHPPLATRYKWLCDQLLLIPIEVRPLREFEKDVLLRAVTEIIDGDLRAAGSEVSVVWCSLVHEKADLGKDSTLLNVCCLIVNCIKEARAQTIDDEQKTRADVRATMTAFSKVLNKRVLESCNTGGEFHKIVSDALPKLVEGLREQVVMGDNEEKVLLRLQQGSELKNMHGLNVVQLTLRRLFSIVKSVMCDIQHQVSTEQLSRVSVSLPSVRDKFAYLDNVSVGVAYYVAGYAMQRTKKYLAESPSRMLFFKAACQPLEFTGELGNAMKAAVDNRERLGGLTRVNQTFFFAFFLPIAKWLIACIDVLSDARCHIGVRSMLITKKLQSEEEHLNALFEEAYQQMLEPSIAVFKKDEQHLITRQLRRRFVNAILLDVLRRQMRTQVRDAKDQSNNATAQEKIATDGGSASRKFVAKRSSEKAGGVKKRQLRICD